MTKTVYYKPVGIDPNHRHLTKGREYVSKEEGEDWFVINSDRGYMLFCLKPEHQYLCAHLENQGKWVRVERDMSDAEESSDA